MIVAFNNMDFKTVKFLETKPKPGNDRNEKLFHEKVRDPRSQIWFRSTYISHLKFEIFELFDSDEV